MNNAEWIDTVSKIYLHGQGILMVGALIELAFLAWWAPRRKISAVDIGRTLGIIVLLYLATPFTMSIVGQALQYVFSHRLFDLRRGPLYYLALLVLFDLCWYARHRVDHIQPWFWAAHRTHHSVKEVTALATWRMHPLGEITFSWLPFLFLSLLGFRVIDITFLVFIAIVCQYIGHSTFRKMPRWIEWAFISPRLHRLHHSSNPLHFNSNYGGILTLWDRVFGTLQEPPPEETFTFGITDTDGSLWDITLGGFLRLLRRKTN